MSQRLRRSQSAQRGRASVDHEEKKDDRMSERTKTQTFRGPRIRGLASFFSSRAVVVQTKHAHRPEAEVASSSDATSSGYVGWPGTQDKDGVTVLALAHSADESEVASAAVPVVTPMKKSPELSLNKHKAESKQNRPVEKLASKFEQRDLPVTRMTEWGKSVPSQRNTALWSHEPPPSPLSKTSSAYFDEHEVEWEDPLDTTVDTTMSPIYSPPTHESLADRRYISPPFTGYRGLIEKTKDVPSLMDDALLESDASSSKATSVVSRGNKHRGGDSESDIFDGLSSVIARESDVFDNISASPRKQRSHRLPERIAENEEFTKKHTTFSVVQLGGGLTAIQTTPEGYSLRKTASEYDENLTNSDVDQYGYARTPGFNEMLTAGRSNDHSLLGIQGNFGGRRAKKNYGPSQHASVASSSSSSSSSSLFTDPYACSSSDPQNHGDRLSEYYIHPSEMKKLLRKYRKLSQTINVDLDLEEFDRIEDETKAFALFEMRSRIMEKDIERGLERRGGTTIVDDMVTTFYNRAAHRIRDAVIVAKAWRDGASPRDVINTALLTRRQDHVYFIKRPLDKAAAAESASSFSSYSRSSSRYYWEAVKWIDDTDFMQYRCPSLGPRHMRGFEMFTIGDCQSILLKLTNDQCMELREELNDATRRQIEAEEMMKEEGETSEEMMTEAEMKYLASMEDVKAVSKRLVLAEQAFSLVRDRIEQLVAKYEALLIKIENESAIGASSVVTASSFYSESDYWSEEENERQRWARRARRAELRAELAVREAMMAKQEALIIEAEKQRELDALKQKLADLQSETSRAISDREHSAVLAQNFSIFHKGESPGISQEQHMDRQIKIESIKKRFRDRMVNRKYSSNNSVNFDQSYGYENASKKEGSITQTPSKNTYLRQAGEEMYQHLDFYERSLRAVEQIRSDH